jgi:putative SOS response-associated peptidase YedK
MDGGTCWLGGIWESYSSPSGDHIESFALLTVQANEDVSEVHHRMPLLLEIDEIGRYLGGEDLRSQPPPMRIDCHVVSREVNAVGNDGPHLVEPVPTLW